MPSILRSQKASHFKTVFMCLLITTMGTACESDDQAATHDINMPSNLSDDLSGDLINNDTVSVADDTIDYENSQHEGSQGNEVNVVEYDNYSSRVNNVLQTSSRCHKGMIDAPIDTTKKRPSCSNQVQLNWFRLYGNEPIIGRFQGDGSRSSESEKRFFEFGNDKFFYSGEIESIEVRATRPNTKPTIQHIRHYIDRYDYPEDFGSKQFYALGDHFFSRERDADIHSLGNTIHYTMIDEDTGKVGRLSTYYMPFDLSGHSVADSRQTQIDGKGLQTILSKLDNFPSHISFPAGSRCYVPKYQVANMPLYIYQPGAFMPGNPTHLDKWQQDVVSMYGDFQMSISSKVGSDNTIEARRLIHANKNYSQTALDFKQLKADMGTYRIKGYYHHDIEYGKYYSTDRQYFSHKISNPNINIVSCNYINDIAAEFLEAKIPNYY